MSVYGDAADEVRAATAGFSARFYGPIAGHARGWLPAIPGGPDWHAGA
jgi:hypothetical protein